MLPLWDVSGDGPAIFVYTMYCKASLFKRKGQNKTEDRSVFLNAVSIEWEKNHREKQMALP